MAIWTEPMRQTFEYYIVDPGTWRDKTKLTNIRSCNIQRDTTVDTLGSATIDTDGDLEECYVRIYLVTNQNGVEEKHPLGTYMVQSPSTSFDGTKTSGTMDAYTPLIELKEKPTPLGYSILKDENILNEAYLIMRENMRAPVVKTECDKTLHKDFVTNSDEKWINFIQALISNADYYLDLDELGRVLFAPKQETDSLQPVWTYSDDNTSILYPDITTSRDLYNIPNVVEVIYSSGSDYFYSKVINDDPNSPISTVKRGRNITHRVVNPSFSGAPSQYQIDEYAKELLKELSTVEYSVSYTHGYCPVRLGDCVRFDHKSAKLVNIKARVISQSIKCEAGCSVSEKAVFTKKLWG